MSNRAFYFAMLLLLGCQIGKPQGFSPATPAKEYIRFNGQVVAIENAVPLAGVMENRSGKERQRTVADTRTVSISPAALLSLVKGNGAALNVALDDSLKLPLLPGLFLPSREQKSFLSTHPWLTLLKRPDALPDKAQGNTP